MIRQATAAALAVLCLWACKGDADFSDAMPAPVTLNADVFRREISDIDRLVFEEKPFVETRREALASRLEDLAGRVRASSDSRFIHRSARVEKACIDGEEVRARCAADGAPQ